MFQKQLRPYHTIIPSFPRYRVIRVNAGVSGTTVLHSCFFGALMCVISEIESGTARCGQVGRLGLRAQGLGPRIHCGIVLAVRV